MSAFLGLALVLLWSLGAGAEEAPPAEGETPAETQDAIVPAFPAPGGVWELEQAWFAPAYSLPERATRLRNTADRLGIEGMDVPARAVLYSDLGEDARERAEAAVLLSPTLPAGHAALARARFAEKNYWRAFRAAFAALTNTLFHLEASFWAAATLSWSFYLALLVGGLGFVAFRGLAVLPLVAHDLGECFESSMAAVSRFSLVAILLLLPAALGEGPLGVLSVLFLLAMLYAGVRERRALIIAATAACLAMGPLAHGVGRVLAAVGSDPLAEATWASEQGFLDPVEALRLVDAGSQDPLALHGIARRYRRAGRLDDADAHFRALLEAEPENPELLNDLGNLRFARGEIDEAIELYTRAANHRESAIIWFNKAQAYGQKIDVSNHEGALAMAESIDRKAMRRLTDRLSGGGGVFVADLPLSRMRVLERLLDHSGAAFAEQARRAWAPGWLGRFGWAQAFCFLALTLLAGRLRGRIVRSQWCSLCASVAEGIRGADPSRSALCEICRQQRGQKRTPSAAYLQDWNAGENTDGGRVQRFVRALFHILGVIVPGTSLGAPRPLSAWLGLSAVTFALALWSSGNRHIPDPLAMGAATAWLTTLFLALALSVYALSAWRQLRVGRA